MTKMLITQIVKTKILLSPLIFLLFNIFCSGQKLAYDYLSGHNYYSSSFSKNLQLVNILFNKTYSTYEGQNPGNLNGEFMSSPWPESSGDPGSTHKGIDFRARQPFDIYSPLSGTVIATDGTKGLCIYNDTYGLTFIFVHCSMFNVTVGQKISRLQLVGKSGDVGAAGNPHLHVELRSGNQTSAQSSAGPSSTNFDPRIIIDYFGSGPNPPLLYSPAANAQNVNLPINFEWESIPGVNGYRIQVFDNELFTGSPLFNYPPEGASAITTPGIGWAGANNNQTYYWQVRVNTDKGTSFWAKQSFTTIPRSPTLSYPLNNQSNVSIPINFDWEDIPEVQNYRIEISEYSDFSNLLVSYPENGGTTQISSYTWMGAKEGTKYYWRVRVNTGGSKTSGWSSGSFTTNTKTVYQVRTSSVPSNGGYTSISGLLISGSLCTVSATPADGFSFLSWTENGVLVSNNPSYMFPLNSSRTLVANFTLNSYNISTVISPAGGGDVLGAKSYQYGQNCTVTAYPVNGYAFTGWTENNVIVSNNTSYSFTVSRNRTLTANFSNQRYNVSVSTDPIGGGIVMGAGSYLWGENCSLSVIPGKEYIFLWWTENGQRVSSSSNYTFPVYSNRTLQAIFEKNVVINPSVVYLINISINPLNGGTCTGDGYYNLGKTCTLTANTSEGYSFSGWTESGTVVSSSQTYTFTANSDRNLVADFTPKNYLVSTTSSPATDGTTTGGGSYTYNQICTATATPNPGYTFTNWTENGSIVSTNANYTFTVSGNKTLVANFSCNLPSSVSVSGGGTFCDIAFLTATGGSGGTIYWQETTSNGTSTAFPGTSWGITSSGTYYFRAYNRCGWGAQGSATVTVNRTPATVTVSGGGTFCNSATLTATGGNGGTIYWQGTTSNGTSTATPGTSQTVTVSGTYYFRAYNSCGWGTHGSASVTINNTPSQPGVISGNTSVTNGTLNTYSISPVNGATSYTWAYSGNGTINGTGTSISLTPTSSGIISVTATNSCGTSSPSTLNITVSNPISYTIALSSNPTAGGTTSGGGSFASGTSRTITATPNAGYTFANWKENGTIVSTNANYSFTLFANRTLVANFTANNYNVTATASPAGGGSITGPGTYQYNQGCTLSAAPASGYSFTGWTENGAVVSTNLNYTFTVTGNRTLIANFSNIPQYTLTLSSNPTAGGVTSGSGTYASNTSRTVTATANTGYTFSKWTENGTQVSTSAIYTFPLTSNRTLVANFTANNYNVTATASPVGGGSITGQGTYQNNQGCTLIATPASGYSFTGWTENGIVVSTNLNYTFTVTGNRTLMANFSTIQNYTISLSSNPLAGGTTSGGGSYASGSIQTVTATPNAGYSFSKWTENGTQVSTSASYTFAVNGGKNLVANFKEINFSIGVGFSPLAGGTVKGGGLLTYNQICTVEAISSAGYNFVNWTENGEIVSTSNIFTFTVSSDRNLYANFSPVFYTITTSTNPTSGGVTSGDGTFLNVFVSGVNHVVSTRSNPGYVFLNWTENGNIVSNNISYSFPVSSNRTLIANHLAVSYYVSTMSNPLVGGATTGNGSYTYNQDCKVTASPNLGYNFTNWTSKGVVVSYSPNYSFKVTGPIDLVANFSTDLQNTINLSSNPTTGGVTSGSGTYANNTSRTITATANAGYTFSKWTENGTQVSNSASYTFTLTSNRTLVANFTANNYNVTATANPAGGGSITGQGTYQYNQSCTLTATPASGYSFTGWMENGTVVSTNLNYTFTVTGNRTLTADFSTIPQYTLTLSSNPAAGGVTRGAGTYASNTSRTVTATPNTGYIFTRWTENGQEVSTNLSFTFDLKSNRTLVANFIDINYTIKTIANPSSGGTIKGSGEYIYNVGCNLTATPASGYSFTGWTENGTIVSTNLNYTFTVTSNRTLTANFSTIPQYTISLSSNPTTGGITSGAGTYASNTSRTVTATPNTGYTFNKWTENGTQVSTSKSYMFVLTANRTIVANFTANNYNVTATANPAGGGSITGQGTYQHNQGSTLTATPASGYNFVNWTENGSVVSTSPGYTFIVTANRNLVANFSTVPSYTIALSSNPTIGGTTSGGGSFAGSTSRTITATPNAGYTFANWKENGAIVSTNANFSFTLTANRTLVANFTNIVKVDNISLPTLNFKVYPNPTTGKVKIEFTQNKIAKTKFSVTNIIGAEVVRKDFSNTTNFEIDLSWQVNGIYILKVIVDDNQYISKIILRKDN